MNSWVESTLEGFVTHKKGFAFKSQWFITEGIPVVKVTDFTESSIDSSSVVYIEEKIAEEKRTYVLRLGDIVIQTVGSWPNNPASVVGKAVSVPEELNGALLNQNAVILRTKKYLENKFLFYLLKSDMFKGYIINMAQGAANQASITLDSIFRFPFFRPPVEEQQKIAAILSAYDDLIENNKRRIALLEKMAEEIYREWFVRFRFPGWENAEFEKGIPVGWEVVRFRDVVKYYIGGGWGEEEESPNYPVGAHVIRGTDIPALNTGDYSNKVYRFHKESNYKSRKLQKNDFIFEVSGGSTNQLLGRNIMISDGLLELFKGEVLCASFCKLIRFDDEIISPFFMKYYFKLYYNCDLVGIYQVQSTGISNYQFESFLNYQTLAVPDRDTSLHFEKIVTPIIKQQECLALENVMLTKTKEQLLPRLISGKLSVEDLDIQFPPSMQTNNTEPEVA